MKTKHLIPLPVVALAAMLCAPSSGSAQSILLSSGNFTLLGGTAIADYPAQIGGITKILSEWRVGLSVNFWVPFGGRIYQENAAPGLSLYQTMT
jgi:hypothetical protein